MDKAIVRTQGGFRTTVQTGEYQWHTDLPEADGGTGSAPNPEQMLLGALGSCMAQTAKIYANHKGFPLEDVEVELSFERINASDYPAYIGTEQFIHEIKERVVLHGPLSDEQKDRIMKVIKKCPVRRLITLPVFFDEELVDELPSAGELVEPE